VFHPPRASTLSVPSTDLSLAHGQVNNSMIQESAQYKKNGMTNRKIEYWVIPPEADGEFVAHMEEVLETYAKPYDPAGPVLCMDEQPVQLLKETCVPIPATRQHGKRVDYEYERAVTTNSFMFTEPLAGWREVAVRDTKTKVDWAIEMALLMEGRYAGAERVVVVCDNLNTYTKGAFYESFTPPPGRASWSVASSPVTRPSTAAG
jgi:hypothetical protein